jgi:hypothetical protein
MMKDNLQEANYDCTEKCDDCGNEQMGTMFHAHNAIGGATPVLWICHRCQNPPMIVGWYREIKRRIRRAIIVTRYYATTTAAEREAKTARFAAARARVAARRAARSVS